MNEMVERHMPYVISANVATHIAPLNIEASARATQELQKHVEDMQKNSDRNYEMIVVSHRQRKKEAQSIQEMLLELKCGAGHEAQDACSGRRLVEGLGEQRARVVITWTVGEHNGCKAGGGMRKVLRTTPAAPESGR